VQKHFWQILPHIVRTSDPRAAIQMTGVYIFQGHINDEVNYLR